EKIKQYEQDHSHTFLFGFEESCGYLRGTHSRDKDAVVASMLFAEMVCYYTYIGKSVYEVLMGIYDKYGYCIDRTDNVMYSGLTAMDDMNNKLTEMFNKHIENFGIFNVLAVRNYREGKRYSADGSVSDLEFKDINCLYYELENDSFICLRPSGTEPKMKIYYCIKGKDKEHTEKCLEKVKSAFLADFE
ncbi:MAG TPA: phosphoglucomutase, partial [Clostridiales bacterium]|nr:phosphoglucomutase [Clostridiales bacterium]